MTSQELQDYLNLYSMFSFRDGRKEPGLLVSKYNTIKGEIEYYFIRQEYMQSYRNAFDKYDRETCNRLTEQVDGNNLVSIRPVSLSDYKIIMELLHERNQLLQSIQ